MPGAEKLFFRVTKTVSKNWHQSCWSLKRYSYIQLHTHIFFLFLEHHCDSRHPTRTTAAFVVIIMYFISLQLSVLQSSCLRVCGGASFFRQLQFCRLFPQYLMPESLSHM
jgi:hypothetical protein